MQATFADPDAADGPWAYRWTWGNGTTTGAWAAPGTYTAARRFQSAGSYSVFLIVTDARGAADTSNVINVTVR
jgi:hypothetical protein